MARDAVALCGVRTAVINVGRAMQTTAALVVGHLNYTLKNRTEEVSATQKAVSLMNSKAVLCVIRFVEMVFTAKAQFVGKLVRVN
jgi:hypothetical protein